MQVTVPNVLILLIFLFWVLKGAKYPTSSLQASFVVKFGKTSQMCSQWELSQFVPCVYMQDLRHVSQKHFCALGQGSDF